MLMLTEKHHIPVPLGSTVSAFGIFASDFLFVREMWRWKNWMEIDGNEFYDGEIGCTKCGKYILN